MLTFYNSALTGVMLERLEDGGYLLCAHLPGNTPYSDTWERVRHLTVIKACFGQAMARNITASQAAVQARYELKDSPLHVEAAVLSNALRKAVYSGDTIPAVEPAVKRFWQELYRMYPAGCFKHGVYTSSEDPSLVAFTEKKPDGTHRRTKTTLGRFLSRRLVDVTPQLLKSLTDEYRLLMAKPNLEFATSSDDVKWIYARAGDSCMSKSDCEDAVTVYADCEHVAVAYFTDSNGEPKARAVVNTRDKLYSTCYGDRAMLTTVLADAGYTASAYTLTQDGIYLSFRGYTDDRNPEGGITCPFIDPIPAGDISRWAYVVEVEGNKRIRIVADTCDGDGEDLYGCNSSRYTEGYSAPMEHYRRIQCEYSGDWVDEAETTYVDGYGYVEACHTAYSDHYGHHILAIDAVRVCYCTHWGDRVRHYDELTFVNGSEDTVDIGGYTLLVESLEDYPRFAEYYGAVFYDGDWVHESDLPDERAEEAEEDDAPNEQVIPPQTRQTQTHQV